MFTNEKHSSKGHTCGKHRRQHGSESWRWHNMLAVSLLYVMMQHDCMFWWCMIVEIDCKTRTGSFTSIHAVKVWYLHPTH